MNRLQKLSLDEIKQTEIDILRYVVAVCERYKICYFLIYGTLLGAVRHQGFIPWDDDIDIYMPRPDYERFITIWEENKYDKSSNFNLFFPGKTEDYYYEYAKVSASNTICDIDIPIKAIKGMGVWIDIFPLDGMPQKYTCYFYTLHYLRQMRSLSVYTRVPKVNSLKTLSIYIGWKIVKTIGWQFFQKKVVKLSKKYDYKTSPYLACTVLASRIKYVYPHSDFDDITQLPFEGTMYNVPAQYHSILTRTYGNYMELPPKDQQISIHSFNAYYIQ